MAIYFSIRVFIAHINDASYSWLTKNHVTRANCFQVHVPAYPDHRGTEYRAASTGRLAKRDQHWQKFRGFKSSVKSVGVAAAWRAAHSTGTWRHISATWDTRPNNRRAPAESFAKLNWWNIKYHHAPVYKYAKFRQHIEGARICRQKTKFRPNRKQLRSNCTVSIWSNLRQRKRNSDAARWNRSKHQRAA